MLKVGIPYRSFVAAAAFAGAIAVMPTGADADLVPHQAIYKLSMADSSPTSRFSGLTGAAVAVMDKTCKGWVVQEQVAMRISTIAGGVIDNDLTYKATESLDGKEFEFDAKRNTNSIKEAFSGNARQKQDGSTEAEFVTPEPFEMPLPDGTRFYIGFTNWLLNLAKSGTKSGSTTTFDGTDDEGPNRVTAFVFPDKGAKEEIDGDPELLAGKAYRARLAFFKVSAPSAEPEFEIALRLLNNGIVTNYQLIFDDLVVDQVLEDVVPAKDERCN